MKSKQLEVVSTCGKCIKEANFLTCFLRFSGGGRNNFAAVVSIDFQRFRYITRAIVKRITMA